MREIEELEDAFPAPDAAEVASAKARVRMQYRAAPNRVRPRRRSRIVAVGLTALAAAACAAAVLLASAGDDSGSTAVARELATLARAAEKAPRATLTGRNIWIYRRINADYGALGTDTVNGRSFSYGYHLPARTETWVSASGIQVDCSLAGRASFYAPIDRQNWIAGGRHSLAPPAGTIGYDRITGDPRKLAGVVPSDLPTTVDGIRTLMQRLPHHDANEVLDTAHQLFLSADVSPATRAAILRYLEHVPGLALMPQATTHAGRVGVGISVAGNGYTGSARWVKRILILNARTAALIGYREVIVGKVPYGGARPGQGDGAWEDDLSLGVVRMPTVKAPTHDRAISISGAPAKFACSKLPRP